MNCIPEYLPPEESTRRIKAETMHQLVYGRRPRKTAFRAALVGAVVGLLGCAGGASEPVVCAPCGDGSIACNGTVADCAVDNGGACETKVGATGGADFTFNSDGSYTETTADGTTTGTWSVASAGSGIVLQPVGAVIGLYGANACPWPVR